MITRNFSASITRESGRVFDVSTDNDAIWIDGTEISLADAKELRVCLDEAIATLESKAKPAAKKKP